MHKILFLLASPALIFSNNIDAPANMDIEKLQLNESGSSYFGNGNTYIDISAHSFYFPEDIPFMPVIPTIGLSKMSSIENGKNIAYEASIEATCFYTEQDYFTLPCFELKFQKLKFEHPEKDSSIYYGVGQV